MKRFIIYIGVLFVTAACAPESFRPRTGDLLFTVGKQSEMTGAITAATGANGALNFSHVGIAVSAERADSVLEATSEGGVRMVPLSEFLAGAARIGDAPAVVVMRLRDTTGTAAAIERGRSCLGLPYDYSYYPDNGKFYCSELVWECYRNRDGSHRFEARPMNFRAADGTMPAFWCELFERLGEPIPEGVPGTNPNDMARDRQLEEVHRYFR